MPQLTKQCNRCYAAFDYESQPGRAGPIYCERCAIEKWREARRLSMERSRKKRALDKEQRKDASELHRQTIQAAFTDS